MDYSRTIEEDFSRLELNLKATVENYRYFRTLLDPKTKLLVLPFPNNPTGAIMDRSDLEAIAEVLKGTDILVMSDEIYAELTYGGARHCAPASLSKDMWDRTITINGFSKAFAMTGWRLGYVLAAEPVMERIKKVHDFLTVGAAAPLMEAAVTALRFDDSYYAGLQAHYTHMRNLFTEGLRNLGLRFSEPQGAYFVLIDISEFGYGSRSSLAGASTVLDGDKLPEEQFCIDMAQKVGVAAVPGSSFFREPVDHLVRLHFAKKDETLYEALNRLEGLKKLKR